MTYEMTQAEAEQVLREYLKQKEAETLQPADSDRFRLEPIDWSVVLSQPIPVLEYLTEPYLPARKRIWAVGPATSGKSIWAAYQSSLLTRREQVVVHVSQENGFEEEVRRFMLLRPGFEHLRLYVDQGLDLNLRSIATS